MAENPRTAAARDTDDRDMINNITADAAAGLSPAASAGLLADLESHADLDEADGTEDRDGPR